MTLKEAQNVLRNERHHHRTYPMNRTFRFMFNTGTLSTKEAIRRFMVRVNEYGYVPVNPEEKEFIKHLATTVSARCFKVGRRLAKRIGVVWIDPDELYALYVL